MTIAPHVFFALLLAPVAFSQPAVPAQVPCSVTQPPVPAFVPPAPYSSEVSEDTFWFGTPELWTRLPRHAGFAQRDKLFWWRPGYDGRIEQRPNIILTVRQTDSGVTSVVAEPATNAFFDGRWSMLSALIVPKPGCWEVTGTYAGHQVKFVTEVP
jgi:hypothetical protein